MLVKEVLTLSPIDRLCYWIQERESIRLKKEGGKSPPWTDDEILQRYRFCNVRRMDDKVSQWLLENWYEPHKGHPNTLLAVAIARFFNLPSTLGELTDLIYCKSSPNWPRIKERLMILREEGVTLFNAAYMVRGNDGVDKVSSVIDFNVRELQRANITIDTNSMYRTWRRIAAVYGYGSFMAGQLVADLRWAIDGEWKDRNTWAPVGPGSSKGLGRTLYENEWESKAQEFAAHPDRFNEILVKELIPILKSKLRKSITDRLEAHDYQNTLCEIGKYSSALLGAGRPKQLYREC